MTTTNHAKINIRSGSAGKESQRLDGQLAHAHMQVADPWETLSKKVDRSLRNGKLLSALHTHNIFECTYT